MRFPGATTSGLIAKSKRVGPRELYGAIASSQRSTVPFVSTAPTVMAAGELPGEVMPPSTGTPAGVDTTANGAVRRDPRIDDRDVDAGAFVARRGEQSEEAARALPDLVGDGHLVCNRH